MLKSITVVNGQSVCIVFFRQFELAADEIVTCAIEVLLIVMEEGKDCLCVTDDAFAVIYVDAVIHRPSPLDVLFS